MNSNLALNDEEYFLFNDFLMDHFGICFKNSKKEILESRMIPRLNELGFHQFMDYYHYLQFNNNGELNRLARLVTNNETYFFREDHQFTALFDHGLEAIKERNRESAVINTLCAGCSSGEEPYTLNMFAAENRNRMWGYTFQIHAFDIDTARLDMARKAQYGSYSLRTLPTNLVQRYFNRVNDSSDPRFEVKPMYRQGITFAQGNIIDSVSYLSAPFDVIFCRNVLIYFSEKALHKAIDHFASALKPGGLLFLGHSESIIGISQKFQPIKLGNCLAYERVK